MSRIILKISGEALKSDTENVSVNKLDIIYRTIEILKNDNHQISVVVGGGNFFRGREHTDMNNLNGDTIGMLGTVMNALYIKDYLEKKDISVILSTPFDFPELIENYTDEKLRDEFNKNAVVVFGGGIGKSGYSTDSGTILACEKLNCDLIIKMTNVDGVYSNDPKIDKDAIKYDKLSYDEVLEHNLKVMDTYAIEKCKENNIKILVMNFLDYKNINKYFYKENIGTIIGE